MVCHNKSAPIAVIVLAKFVSSDSNVWIVKNFFTAISATLINYYRLAAPLLVRTAAVLLMAKVALAKNNHRAL